jgi:hypothetical protein
MALEQPFSDTDRAARLAAQEATVLALGRLEESRQRVRDARAVGDEIALDRALWDADRAFNILKNRVRS